MGRGAVQGIVFVARVQTPDSRPRIVIPVREWRTLTERHGKVEQVRVAIEPFDPAKVKITTSGEVAEREALPDPVEEIVEFEDGEG